MGVPQSGRPADRFGEEGVSYSGVRIVVKPVAPRHYDVTVSVGGGDLKRHAVEHVVVNTSEVVLDDDIWFADATVDVGVPIDGHGDTVWIWT